MKIEYREVPLLSGMLEGAGQPLTMHQKGEIMENDFKTVAKSAKAMNNEIVKALITMLQTFTEQQYPDGGYQITVSEATLVSQVGGLIRTYQRQQDRMGDVVDLIKKISSGG